MMKNSLISIIVPCYNVEKYLPKCLDSIINQTYKNLEIICVNDGSRDDTLKVLNEYSQKDERIIVVNQENSGSSAARNNAFKYVTGDYIMFVDSDDWIELNCCEKAINMALENNADLVIWNYIRQFPNNPMPRLILGEKKLIFDEKECKTKIHRRIVGLYNNELSAPEKADSLVTVWGKLYCTRLIVNDDIQFDTKLICSEDTLFNVYALKNINKVVYIPDCLYNYRKDNRGSVTSNYKSNLFSQWQHLFCLIYEFLKSNDFDGTYYDALNNRICLSIIGLGLNIVNAGKEVHKIRKIKKIISSPRYRQAYENLTLKYFPIHWKVFFAFAKYKCSLGVYLMLTVIKILKGKLRRLG